MIKFLEDKLYEKTKDSQSQILFAQWNYDKQIIPTALQAVSNLFPHYSLHDESHSVTILNNIVRVLGKENIDRLSAIDIWLILEASYYHDIGMVVPSDKLEAAVRSDKFIGFLEELIQDNKNGLHDFASLFQVENKKIKFRTDFFDLGTYEGIKFILAEFFRRVHADRSKDIINNPAEELSLRSPRGVIPPRIFNLLGDICSCHTKNFSDVMKLPFCQVGIDTEDAHPRFIACLLRIGDLLDLDNNRFSEVILRTLSKIPIDTLNHKAKHLSIESFRVDREEIQITAKCKDYDTATITQHWFNYLNSEVSNQMINWNNIVPNKSLGYLPTIGALKVELLDYEYIDGKNKPKFSVDTDKALALLQGAGIYEGVHQCIREVLQNAVDATLIRMWLEYKNVSDFATPQSEEFIDLTSKFPVQVNVAKLDFEDGFQHWKIEIEDQGIGISSQDLKYLMNTGSSSKNRNKLEIIESMPVWMRPSGTFGIGFQSIFMLTDTVVLETKSFFDEKFNIIELNSPNSKKDGNILIQNKKTNHLRKPGTKLIIKHRTRLIPRKYSIPGRSKNSLKLVENYDPFTHESLNVEISKIIDEVTEFSLKSILPIKLLVDGKSLSIESQVEGKFNYFDPDNSLEMTIGVKHHSNNEVRAYFKGQPTESSLSFYFLNFSINIHGMASEVLELSRNKIRSDYSNELYRKVLRSSFAIITDNFNNIFKTDEEKEIASMFLHYYSDQEEVADFNISTFDQWKDFLIDVEGRDIKMFDILSSIDHLKLTYNLQYRDSAVNKYISRFNIKIVDRVLVMDIYNGYIVNEYVKFLLDKASSIFMTVDEVVHSNTTTREVSFTKGKKGVISDDLFVRILERHRSGRFSARIIIPCTEELTMLRIKDDVGLPYMRDYILNEYVFIQYFRMVSPYVRETDDDKIFLKFIVNDKLIDWVYKNRYDQRTTREQIEEGYSLINKKINLKEVNS